MAPGRTAFGDSTTLPESARDTAARIGPVTDAAGITAVDATVRRNHLIDDAVTGGILVAAADPSVLEVVGGRAGRRPLPRRRLRPAADRGARMPTPPAGSGITDADAGVRVWLGGQWFAVIGILEPAPLAPGARRLRR